VSSTGSRLLAPGFSLPYIPLMTQTLRAGIIGAGWPGGQHAKGYKEAGGFKIAAVADLIPARRERMIAEYGQMKQYADANELIKDKDIDIVSVCLPTFLHAPTVLAALRAGKHVMCEKPPAMDAREAKKLEAAATKAKKILMYAVQRRFGGAEQAAKQALAKGMAGETYHARAGWLRTRGIPIGTGWFTDKSKSGGGALIDIGVHMLDLSWYLLGQPKPISAFGATHQRFPSVVAPGRTFDVEDAAFAIIRFEGGKTLELSTSWALNQPPQQQGTVVRIFGEKAAVDVYTPQGAMIYRDFNERGDSRASVLKPPRVVSHAALMRHFKECIHGKATPIIGAREGVQLMQMLDAIYKSATTGKSVEIR
jgi:predicted dehydrogenase